VGNLFVEKMKRQLFEHRFTILFLFLAFSFTFYYAKYNYRQAYDEKVDRHVQTLTHTAPYPYAYRVLQTYLTEVVRLPLGAFVNYKKSFLAACVVVSFVFYFLAFWLFFKYLLLWFDESLALVGTLLFIAALPISLTGWDETGDIIMLVVFETAFLLMFARKSYWLLLVIFIGAFNREQTVLVAAFYFFSRAKHLREFKAYLNAAMMVLAFLTGWGVLHLWVGTPAALTQNASSYLSDDFYFNLQHLGWIPIWTASIGVLLVFAAMDLKKKPEFLRMNFLTTLPIFFFIMYLLRARLREIDKAFAIHLILIPLALFTLFPEDEEDA
jgi:hypothetical protein